MLNKVINNLFGSETFKNLDLWALVGATAASALFFKRIIHQKDRDQLLEEFGQKLFIDLYWVTLDNQYMKTILRQSTVCKILEKSQFNDETLSQISEDTVNKLVKQETSQVILQIDEDIKYSQKRRILASFAKTDLGQSGELEELARKTFAQLRGEFFSGPIKIFIDFKVKQQICFESQFYLPVVKPRNNIGEIDLAGQIGRKLAQQFDNLSKFVSIGEKSAKLQMNNFVSFSKVMQEISDIFSLMIVNEAKSSHDYTIKFFCSQEIQSLKSTIRNSMSDTQLYGITEASIIEKVLFLNLEEITEEVYPGYRDLSRRIYFMGSNLISVYLEKYKELNNRKSLLIHSMLKEIREIFENSQEQVFDAIPKLLEQHGKNCPGDLREQLDWRTLFSKYEGLASQSKRLHHLL